MFEPEVELHVILAVSLLSLFGFITLIRRTNRMSQQLDDLTAEVTNATTVEQGAITLIQNIAAQLAAAGTDPVKLQALKDQLSTSDAALAAAITANTPAAPTA